MPEPILEYQSPVRPTHAGAWWRSRTLWRLLPLVGVILLLSLLFQIVMRLQPEGRNFITYNNLFDMLDQVSINAILAMGMTLTIMIGGIDLSVGRVAALSGTVCVFMLRVGDPTSQNIMRLLVALLAGMVIGAGVGSINGVFSAWTRVPPFIVTLATALIARGCALRFNNGEAISVPIHDRAFAFIGTGHLIGPITMPIVIMAAVFIFCVLLLHRTRFGQHLYAIGGSREAARFTGIPLTMRELCVYMLAGLLAGLGGIIDASRLYSGIPSSGEGYELDAIAAAVVGGTALTGGVGTIYGTVLGAVIMGILSKGLNQTGVHFSLQSIIKGLVILTAVFIDVRGKK